MTTARYDYILWACKNWRRRQLDYLDRLMLMYYFIDDVKFAEARDRKIALLNRLAMIAKSIELREEREERHGPNTSCH